MLPVLKNSFWLCAAALSIHTSTATAQTTFRCDVGGQTVYRDTPCPPAAAAKAVGPSQDSAEQRANSAAANAQMRSDNAELNKRLTEREKLEAAERTAARKAVKNAKADKAKAAKAKGNAKAKTAKAKTAKKPAKTKSKKKAANATVVSS